MLQYCSYFVVCPAGARFQRVQVPNPPGSGKDIAEGKGVHREVEYEGSRMADLWSEGQKSHIRIGISVLDIKYNTAYQANKNDANFKCELQYK